MFVGSLDLNSLKIPSFKFLKNNKTQNLSQTLLQSISLTNDLCHHAINQWKKLHNHLDLKVPPHRHSILPNLNVLHPRLLTFNETRSLSTGLITLLDLISFFLFSIILNLNNNRHQVTTLKTVQ